jgi:hypothetical protein
MAAGTQRKKARVLFVREAILPANGNRSGHTTKRQQAHHD